MPSTANMLASMRPAAIPLGPLIKLKKGFWLGSGLPGRGVPPPIGEIFAVSCARRTLASMRVALVDAPSRKRPAKRRRTVLRPTWSFAAVVLSMTKVSCPSQESECPDVLDDGATSFAGPEPELDGLVAEGLDAGAEVVNSSAGCTGCLWLVSVAGVSFVAGGDDESAGGFCAGVWSAGGGVVSVGGVLAVGSGVVAGGSAGGVVSVGGGGGVPGSVAGGVVVGGTSCAYAGAVASAAKSSSAAITNARNKLLEDAALGRTAREAGPGP